MSVAASRARARGDVPASPLLLRGLSAGAFALALRGAVPPIAEAVRAAFTDGPTVLVGALPPLACLLAAPFLVHLVAGAVVTRGAVRSGASSTHGARRAVEIGAALAATASALVTLAVDASSLAAATDGPRVGAVALALTTRALGAGAAVLTVAGLVDLALDRAAWVDRWARAGRDADGRARFRESAKKDGHANAR